MIGSPTNVAEPGDLAGPAYQIVTLAELFAFVASYTSSEDEVAGATEQNAALVQFNIETKRVPDDPARIGDGFNGVDPGPFELAILDEVAQAGLTERVIIQSFDHRSLQAIRSVNDEIRLAALTRDPEGRPGSFAAWGATIWSPRASTLTRGDRARSPG